MVGFDVSEVVVAQSLEPDELVGAGKAHQREWEALRLTND